MPKKPELPSAAPYPKETGIGRSAGASGGNNHSLSIPSDFLWWEGFLHLIYIDIHTYIFIISHFPIHPIISNPHTRERIYIPIFLFFSYISMMFSNGWDENVGKWVIRREDHPDPQLS